MGAVQDRIPDGFLPYKPPRNWVSTIIAVVLLLLGGMMLVWAVEFHWLGWSALVDEAGGSCGSGGRYYRRPCPRGLGWVLGLAFVWSFVGVFFVIAAVAYAAKRGMLGRPVRRIVLVTGMLAGIVPGIVGYHWLRTGEVAVSTAGPKKPATLGQLWAAPADRPSSVEGLGLWTDGSTVVRARVDEAIAYDVPTGRVLWTFSYPGEDSLCSMSRSVSGGIGLLSFSPDGQPCATVVAVDLHTGKQLWEAKRDADERGSNDVYYDDIAVAGNTAVLKEPNGILGVDLHTGKQAWQTPVPDSGCLTDDVAAGSKVVLVAVNCNDAGGKVWALGAADGKQLWESNAPFGGRMEVAEVVLSVEPAVLRLKESGSRGKDVVVAYDSAGKQRSVIPVSQPDEDLQVSSSASAFSKFAATPFAPAVVSGDTLVTAAAKAGSSTATQVSAYSLADGHRLWQTSTVSDTSDEIQALVVDGGTVRVAMRSIDPVKVRRLDVATGRVVDSATGSDSFPYDRFDTMLYVAGHDVFVLVDGTSRQTPPIQVAK